MATWSGFLFVAVVIDAFSRRVIGWAMENHLRTELVLAALTMAYTQRAPCPKVIFHTDHGTQFTSRLGEAQTTREHAGAGCP